MSGPTKELEEIVLGEQLNHGKNPVLRWMASNVSIEQDAAGNIKASKANSTERIDGIIASIMALGRVIANAEPVEITPVANSVSFEGPKGVITPACGAEIAGSAGHGLVG